jgi:hypothetical protein
MVVAAMGGAAWAFRDVAGGELGFVPGFRHGAATQKKEKKVFFSEEKKQKTFISAVAP